MSSPLTGPTLRKEHKQAHSKDYAVTRLLTLLDMNTKPERDSFASSLRSLFDNIKSERISKLSDSHLKDMARTFLSESKHSFDCVNGTKYFPPMYLHNIPGFASKKWTYDRQGEAIVNVVAKILATQRNSVVKRKRIAAAKTERVRAKRRSREAARRNVSVVSVSESGEGRVEGRGIGW